MSLVDMSHTNTPQPDTRTALAELVDAILQLKGLIEQVGQFTVPADTCDHAPALVAAVCLALGVPLHFQEPDDEQSRNRVANVLAARIRQAQQAPEFADLGTSAIAHLAEQARSLRDEAEAEYRWHLLHRPDGATVRVLDCGPLDAPFVVFSPACTMDIRLCLPWTRVLSDRYRCLVPQTRGTAGRIEDPEDFDRYGYGVEEQAGDLAAVLAEFAVSGAHLLALCGGAVPALAIAEAHANHISSLSLWHADLELGEDAPKTEYQNNLRAVLDIAAESRGSAAWVRERFASGPMSGVPEDVASLVMRPYATPELFYRYARLTGSTMHWDCRAAAARIVQPTLIVTSRDDHTTHPAGSLRLAEILPEATTAVVEHGTHLDSFRATPEQVRCLLAFLAAHAGLPGD